MAVDTEQVVREVLNLTPLLRKNIIRPVETCFDRRVSTNQLGILTALLEHGPQTMRQLGRQIVVCRQQMTQLIDELEKKGYVSREASETDRRATNIRLTDQGLHYINELNAQMRRELYAIFDGYTDAQKADLVETTQKMKRIMDG